MSDNEHSLRACLQREIQETGGRALFIRTDLSKRSDIAKLSSDVKRSLGGLDVLVNNGATYWSGPLLVQTPPSDWATMLNTNLRAPYLLARAFAPGMVEQGHGRIVNIISATSHVNGIGCFRISKISLEVLTSVLAAELQEYGVATTALNPNWFRSDHSLSGPSPSCPEAYWGRSCSRIAHWTKSRS